jgi:hypothetical protein
LNANGRLFFAFVLLHCQAGPDQSLDLDDFGLDREELLLNDVTSPVFLNQDCRRVFKFLAFFQRQSVLFPANKTSPNFLDCYGRSNAAASDLGTMRSPGRLDDCGSTMLKQRTFEKPRRQKPETKTKEF